MRILVVDGDLKTRMKLRRLLSAFGDCDDAPTGALAVRLFIHSHQESAPYGLIATDMDLPDMDGNAMIQKIRQWESNELKLAQDKQVKILKTRTPEDKTELRVLVVDDDYVSRTKLRAMLSKYGQCDCVPDGRTAIEMVQQAHSDGNPYELVTMDINMPGMRGPDVVQGIRSWEKDSGLEDDQLCKILMVTGTEDSDEMMKCFEEGAESYVKKPVIPGTLRISLENVGIISKTQSEA